MEKMLREFAEYDEKTRGVVVEYIVEKYEKFFIALKYTDIPIETTNELYDVQETINQIQENVDDANRILSQCKAGKPFLDCMRKLALARHPMLKKYRFVKTRDLNQAYDQQTVCLFLYPKCRLWIFIKYQRVWCMIKNRDIENKKNVRDYFQREFQKWITDDYLYVFEVCFETRRTDEVTGYHILDVLDYGGVSMANKRFEQRYNFLCHETKLNVLPLVFAPRDNDKHLVKRKADTLYDRTECTLVLSRLKMDQYYLLIGETHINDKTKVYVAKLDQTCDNFVVVGCTLKNKSLMDKKLDYVDKGYCIFGCEYVWKCAIPVDINYYKNPIAAKLMVMSTKINMRSSIKEILENPPIDRTLYVLN